MDAFAYARSKRSTKESDEKDRKTFIDLLGSVARFSELDTIDVFTRSDIKETYKLNKKSVTCVVNVIAKVLLLAKHLAQDNKNDIKRIIEHKLTDPLIDTIHYDICVLLGEFEDDEDQMIEITEAITAIFFEPELIGATAWKVINARLDEN